MISYEAALERLKEEIKKYGKIFIAFDFDNTIFDYHNSGEDNSSVIELLRRCSDLGHKLILFTATSDNERLEFMKLYCKHYGIKITYINENPEVPGGVKPYYNILLDDRAGLEESYRILNKAIS